MLMLSKKQKHFRHQGCWSNVMICRMKLFLKIKFISCYSSRLLFTTLNRGWKIVLSAEPCFPLRVRATPLDSLDGSAPRTGMQAITRNLKLVGLLYNILWLYILAPFCLILFYNKVGKINISHLNLVTISYMHVENKLICEKLAGRICFKSRTLPDVCLCYLIAVLLTALICS